MKKKPWYLINQRKIKVCWYYLVCICKTTNKPAILLHYNETIGVDAFNQMCGHRSCSTHIGDCNVCFMECSISIMYKRIKRADKKNFHQKIIHG